MKRPVAISDCQRRSSAGGTTAWSRRWDELRRARCELDHWRELASEAEADFKESIAPRERCVTRTLADLTAHLMDRFPENALNATEQTLLAQWITENLATPEQSPVRPN